MNSDEIIKALRYCMVLHCEKCPKYETAINYPSCMIELEEEAASTIESLTAQLAAYKKTDLTADEIFQMRREWRDTEKGLRDSVIHLQSQLAESQRREKAAVEDITHDCDTCLYADCAWDKPPCETCIEGHVLSSIARTDNWEWRGTQDAGEGGHSEEYDKLISEARELCEEVTSDKFVICESFDHAAVDSYENNAGEPIAEFLHTPDAKLFVRSRTLIPELCDALEKAIAEHTVKHGKWIDDGFNFAYCSECKKSVSFYEFCPSCGARMDKEDKH